MPINKNHEFEDLDGIKCAIVEKNATKERVAFLKQILMYNHYTVVVVSSPPPKTIPPKPAPAATSDVSDEVSMTAAATTQEPKPETFTVGVTDVTFNATNAIFGRSLKMPDGHIVTLAYWQQKEKELRDDIPYFDNKK